MDNEYDNPLNGPPRNANPAPPAAEVPPRQPSDDPGRHPALLPGKEYSPVKSFLTALLIVMAVLFAGCVVLVSQLSWTKGRPLRGRWRSRARGGSRSKTSPAQDAAAQWRAMATDEYESIASFSELALDLMAAGAPSGLVRRCHEAALEEERHTRICLDIARHLDGQDAPLPDIPAVRTTRRRPRWRTALLVRLAVESYVDGCIGEASSAWVLARLRRTTESSGISDALQSLAREEMGHAALGRDIVRWCCDEGGPVVIGALARTRARVTKMQAPRTGVVPTGALRRFGVPDDDLRAQAFDWARTRAA